MSERRKSSSQMPVNSYEVSQLSTRLNVRVKEAVEHYCREQGVKMNHFVETALIDKLQELEDIEDVRRLRREPTRPLSEVLKELGLE